MFDIYGQPDWDEGYTAGRCKLSDLEQLWPYPRPIGYKAGCACDRELLPTAGGLTVREIKDSLLQVFLGYRVETSGLLPRTHGVIRYKRWKRLNRPDKIKEVLRQEPLFFLVNRERLWCHPDNVAVLRRLCSRRRRFPLALRISRARNDVCRSG